MLVILLVPHIVCRPKDYMNIHIGDCINKLQHHVLALYYVRSAKHLDLTLEIGVMFE